VSLFEEEEGVGVAGQNRLWEQMDRLGTQAVLQHPHPMSMKAYNIVISDGV
jgi:hypothetical protein